MGRHVQKRLTQKTTYLAISGRERSGRPTVSTAVQINTRWEEKSEELLKTDGTTIEVVSVVIVDQDITEGSIMWQGALVDFASPYSDLRQVYSFSKIPDIKGRNFRRVCKLTRYSKQLTTIV